MGSASRVRREDGFEQHFGSVIGRPQSPSRNDCCLVAGSEIARAEVAGPEVILRLARHQLDAVLEGVVEHRKPGACSVPPYQIFLITLNVIEVVVYPLHPGHSKIAIF